MDIPPTVGLQKAAFGIHFFAYHYMTNSGIYVNGFVSCGGGGIGSKRPDPLFPKEPGSGVDVHHLQAREDGGTHRLNNLITLCNLFPGSHASWKRATLVKRRTNNAGAPVGHAA
jgi:hypothetical protein